MITAESAAFDHSDNDEACSSSDEESTCPLLVDSDSDAEDTGHYDSDSSDTDSEPDHSDYFCFIDERQVSPSQAASITRDRFDYLEDYSRWFSFIDKPRKVEAAPVAGRKLHVDWTIPCMLCKLRSMLGGIRQLFRIRPRSCTVSQFARRARWIGSRRHCQVPQSRRQRLRRRAPIKQNWKYLLALFLMGCPVSTMDKISTIHSDIRAQHRPFSFPITKHVDYNLPNSTLGHTNFNCSSVYVNGSDFSTGFANELSLKCSEPSGRPPQRVVNPAEKPLDCHSHSVITFLGNLLKGWCLQNWNFYEDSCSGVSSQHLINLPVFDTHLYRYPHMFPKSAVRT